MYCDAIGRRFAGRSQYLPRNVSPLDIAYLTLYVDQYVDQYVDCMLIVC